MKILELTMKIRQEYFSAKCAIQEQPTKLTRKQTVNIM